MDFNKKEMPIQGFAGFGGGTIDVPSGLTTIVTVPYDADENGWSTVEIWFEFTKVEGEISLVKFGFWMRST